MHQAASDRWASLSFFSSNSAKRIVHQRDRPQTARPSLVRRILFPWMAISLTGELVGDIVQGVQDGDDGLCGIKLRGNSPARQQRWPPRVHDFRSSKGSCDFPPTIGDQKQHERDERGHPKVPLTLSGRTARPTK